jgi:hypothetical protein
MASWFLQRGTNEVPDGCVESNCLWHAHRRPSCAVYMKPRTSTLPVFPSCFLPLSEHYDVVDYGLYPPPDRRLGRCARALPRQFAFSRAAPIIEQREQTRHESLATSSLASVIWHLASGNGPAGPPRWPRRDVSCPTSGPHYYCTNPCRTPRHSDS